MALTRRSVLKTSLVAAPLLAGEWAVSAWSRSYHLAPGCNEMADWHLRVGTVRLRIPVNYNPRIHKKVAIPVTFWQRTLFGRKYAEDQSSVPYCRKPPDPEWIDVDNVSFDGTALQALVKKESVGSEGLSYLVCSAPPASTILETAHWIESPQKDFLFSGGWYLTKEKLLRGGQAMGFGRPRPRNGPIVWPFRFYIKTSDSLRVIVDSRGFTLHGLDGLKSDLKAVELLLNRIIVP